MAELAELATGCWLSLGIYSWQEAACDLPRGLVESDVIAQWLRRRRAPTVALSAAGVAFWLEADCGCGAGGGGRPGGAPPRLRRGLRRWAWGPRCSGSVVLWTTTVCCLMTPTI